MRPDNITFRLTTSDTDFSFCANMMSVNDPWITLGLGYEQCLSAFGGAFREVWLAESDGIIVGFVIMQTAGTFSGYIQTICVSEQFRGRKIGTRLLELCESKIMEYSPNVFICVSSFNREAAQLYYRYGFKLVGEMENFVTDGYTELLLRKTAGPRSGFKPVKKL